MKLSKMRTLEVGRKEEEESFMMLTQSLAITKQLESIGLLLSKLGFLFAGIPVPERGAGTEYAESSTMGTGTEYRESSMRGARAEYAESSVIEEARTGNRSESEPIKKNGEPCMVLLDQSLEFAESLRSFLAKHGICLYSFDSASNLIESMADINSSLLLIDIEMTKNLPENTLRKLGELQTRSIILGSAISRAEIDWLAEFGLSCFLLKKQSNAEILKLLHNRLTLDFSDTDNIHPFV